MKRTLWIILGSIFLLLGGLFLAFEFSFSADQTALAALASDETVSVTETEYGWFFDGPGEEDAMVFYTGAFVEESAYAPMLRLLAEQGLDVCLLNVPLKLSTIDMNQADKAIALHDYQRWYVGGHSLGGAVAAIYAAEHDTINGVILLAAYPTKPLVPKELELVIYGSEDGILNRNRIKKGRQYASDNAVEFVIPGGNHAQFGNYGRQIFDGEATISPEEQQSQTAAFIMQQLHAQ